jgi:hypothetical protein
MMEGRGKQYRVEQLIGLLDPREIGMNNLHREAVVVSATTEKLAKPFLGIQGGHAVTQHREHSGHGSPARAKLEYSRSGLQVHRAQNETRRDQRLAGRKGAPGTIGERAAHGVRDIKHRRFIRHVIRFAGDAAIEIELKFAVLGRERIVRHPGRRVHPKCCEDLAQLVVRRGPIAFRHLPIELVERPDRRRRMGRLRGRERIVSDARRPKAGRSLRRPRSEDRSKKCHDPIRPARPRHLKGPRPIVEGPAAA